MSQNVDAKYASEILESQLTADRKVLDQTDAEINRLQIKRVEMAYRVQFLEDAAAKLKS
jgi:hypothetical protein